MKTPLNPNGDSELAILMREMFDDAMKMKEGIEKGKLPKSDLDISAIHTADATEPEKVQTEQYRVFADSYLAAMESIEESSRESVADPYRGMVESCMNCHKAMCPGPIVKIEKLYLAGKE